MEEQDILKLARETGFEAALLPASQVPTDAKFRPFCEETAAGNTMLITPAHLPAELRSRWGQGSTRERQLWC